jgi:hypothetical protein
MDSQNVLRLLEWVWHEFERAVHAIGPYAFIIEIVVLYLIVREIRALRQHESRLDEHSRQLEAATPLITSFRTGPDEIMNLAVSFVREAKEIRSLGTVNSALVTERRSTDTDETYTERLHAADPRTIDYIQATLKHIMDGKRYTRILDVSVDDPEEIDELLCNIRFFKRMMEIHPAARENFRVFHNPIIFKGEGDFHFRCSDIQVVIRVGASDNPNANAAISITDTRVVQAFSNYYDGLTRAVGTRELTYADLIALEQQLSARNLQSVNDILDSN